MRHVQKVSSGYVGSVAGGILVGMLLVVIGAVGSAASPGDPSPTPVVLLVVGVLLTLYAEIVFLVLLYKAWACIQDGSSRTSAGQAVGFLFVPIFNFYWIFRALPGFADEYNLYLERAGVSATPLTRGSLQGLAVLSVLTIIPILGGVAAVVGLVVQCSATAKLADAINALAETASSREIGREDQTEIGSDSADFRRGVEFLSNGDPRAALLEFQKSLAKAGGDAKADWLYNIALCHLRLGHLDAAMHAVTEAVTIDPGLAADFRADPDFATFLSDASFQDALTRADKSASVGPQV